VLAIDTVTVVVGWRYAEQKELAVISLVVARRARRQLFASHETPVLFPKVNPTGGLGPFDSSKGTATAKAVK